MYVKIWRWYSCQHPNWWRAESPTLIRYYIFWPKKLTTTKNLHMQNINHDPMLPYDIYTSGAHSPRVQGVLADPILFNLGVKRYFRNFNPPPPVIALESPSNSLELWSGIFSEGGGGWISSQGVFGHLERTKKMLPIMGKNWWAIRIHREAHTVKHPKNIWRRMTCKRLTRLYLKIEDHWNAWQRISIVQWRYPLAPSIRPESATEKIITMSWQAL